LYIYAIVVIFLIASQLKYDWEYSTDKSIYVYYVKLKTNIKREIEVKYSTQNWN